MTPGPRGPAVASPQGKDGPVPLKSLFSLSLLAAASALFVASCNKPGESESKGKEGGSAATACADYAKTVCKEAGEQSAHCTTIKGASELLPPAACTAAAADFTFTKGKLAAAGKACDELATKLCAEIGKDTETCTMVKTQTKQFPPERCTQMMGHFAEVAADLKRREAKNQPLTPDKIALIAKADAPSFGPENSPVTLVEFSDFQCPYCSRAANMVTKLKEKYGDRVRFVFRQFPLSFHQNAHLASQASLAAHAQGKFWQYHDKLFADQAKLERPALEASAKEVGLDMAAFKKALDDKTYAAAVDADLKLGEQVSVDGTPTLFLNGKRIQVDPSDFDAVSKLIDAALGKSS